AAPTGTTVPVRIIIGADGTLGHIPVIRGSAEQRTSIIAALAQWRFEPKPAFVRSPVPRVRPPVAPPVAPATPRLGYLGGLAEPLLYSSWRRHHTPVSLRPLGARSSHWYMPQRPSSPRA